jgi:hypothetical protein
MDFFHGLDLSNTQVDEFVCNRLPGAQADLILISSVECSIADQTFGRAQENRIEHRFAVASAHQNESRGFVRSFLTTIAALPTVWSDCTPLLRRHACRAMSCLRSTLRRRSSLCSSAPSRTTSMYGLMVFMRLFYGQVSSSHCHLRKYHLRVTVHFFFFFFLTLTIVDRAHG